MASQQNAEKNKKSLARFLTNIKKTVAGLFLKIMNFHLCMRVTRVHNESGVDLLWVPTNQLGAPLNDLRRLIRPGQYMDTHFGDYTPACPDLYIFVHVFPENENGEEGNRVVLTSDQIREASKIDLFLNNEGKVDCKRVKRADLPKGFSCCFSAPINKVIPSSNSRKEEEKEHRVEAAERASEDLNLRDAQPFDPPVEADVNMSYEREKLKEIRIAEPSEEALRVAIDECPNEEGISNLLEATFADDIQGTRRKEKTTLKDIWNLKSQRIIVSFNSSLQPIGQESQILTSFCDLVAKSSRFCYFRYRDWHSIPSASKKQMKDFIKKRFLFETDNEDGADIFVLELISKKFEEYRSNLKKKYYDENKTPEEVLINVPKDYNSCEWEAIVSHWYPRHEKEKFETGKQSRLHQRHHGNME